MVGSVYLVTRFPMGKVLAFSERADAEAVAGLMAFEGEDPAGLVHEGEVVLGVPAPEDPDDPMGDFMQFLDELGGGDE